MSKPECIGNCRLCTALGACPSDTEQCEDCGESLEPGEGVEVEVEAIERGKYHTKMITVCSKCFETYYQSGTYDEFS